LYDLIKLELGARYVSLLPLFVRWFQQFRLEVLTARGRAGMKPEVLRVGAGAHDARHPVGDAEENQQQASNEQHALVRGKTPNGGRHGEP
jgi:hypothetical protein